MIEKEIRRFEFEANEALEMVRDYLRAHYGVDCDMVNIKHIASSMETPGGVVIEVEVE